MRKKLVASDRWGAMVASMLLVAGCSTAEKAELSTTNPEQAIQALETQKNDLIELQADVLAYDDFQDGLDDLDRAKRRLGKDANREDVLSYLGQAKAHFNKAESVAADKGNLPQEVLQARDSALEAGAMSSEKLSKKLADIDSDLRDETDEFTEELSAETSDSIQRAYLDLEVAAVQHKELHAFRAVIESADDNDADDVAPKTFRKAKLAVGSAENMIAQSPRTPDNYKDSVMQANKSAKLLDDVMNKLMNEAQGSSEPVALKLVYQDRKLGKLSETLGSLRSNLARYSNTLEAEKAEILSAKAQLKYQKAIEQVRTELSPDEAEIYQQGNRLIIRLKDLDFAVGSAELPNSSMALLTKVKDIVKEIDPERVQIQGHTDSTGSQALNQKLSEKRAKAVQDYFVAAGVKYPMDAIGYGESQPLANNETKKGRAINRRVDILIDGQRNETVEQQQAKSNEEGLKSL